MHIERHTIVVIVGAVIAILLQLMVAPNIAIFHAVPNFMLAFVLVVAIAKPDEAGIVLPFVMGLFYDLLGTGPLGGMALLFMLVSFVAAKIFMILDNDTLFMPLIILIIATLIVEVMYGGLLILLGLPVTPLDALLYRALPCSLYDCAFALIMYPIMVRLLRDEISFSASKLPR